MSAEFVWALVDAADYCVGEVVSCCRPGSTDTATPFDVAVLVDRRGDMMVEDIVVDREAGTGHWIEHAKSKRHSELLAQLNAMDRAQFFDFIMAAVRERA